MLWGKMLHPLRLLFFCPNWNKSRMIILMSTIELDDVDITSAETKATYDEIKKYVAEHNDGMKVSNLYISQVKRKWGIEVAKNLRVATRRMDCLQGNSTTAATDLELVPSPNLPKNEDSRQPQCPEDKESAIVKALKHFKMNS